MRTTLLSPRPAWRNWQTRTTQNRVPSGGVGSIPSAGGSLSVWKESLWGRTPKFKTSPSSVRKSPQTFRISANLAGGLSS